MTRKVLITVALVILAGAVVLGGPFSVALAKKAFSVMRNGMAGRSGIAAQQGQGGMMGNRLSESRSGMQGRGGTMGGRGSVQNDGCEQDGDGCGMLGQDCPNEQDSSSMMGGRRGSGSMPGRQGR